MSDTHANITSIQRSLTVLIAGLLYCSSSVADTSLTFSSSDGSQLPQNIALGDGKLRISSASDDEWMLYDLQQNAMFMINDTEQTYYRIDQAQIEKLGDSLGDLSSQLDDAMANLPPEQRAAAKAMMKGMLGKQEQPEAAVIDIRSTGQQDKVADIACSVHETWVADQRKNEICIADKDALNLSGQDLETLAGMSSLMQQMLDEVQKNVGKLLPTNIAGDGIAQMMGAGMPVRIRDFDNDNQAELTAVSYAAIPAEQLSLPAGYKMQSIDMGR